MIKISDITPMRAAWTKKPQWESGFHRSMINATAFELGREYYLLHMRAGLNKNLEFQIETYWLGDGRLEGVAVIEPENGGK